MGKRGFTPHHTMTRLIKCLLQGWGLKPRLRSPRHPHKWGAGFTLIEVMVAMAIMAISLVVVMQLFSASLKISRLSGDYTRAIVHAKGKMEELSIKPGQGTGVFEDGFKWESEVQPYEDIKEELETLDVNLLKIKVKIIWSGKSNKQESIEMASLRIIQEDKK
ncbi:MAG: prepilin-type N-terminal cleavage/methylation domain-containing protein [Nitrospirota bacterium]